VIAVAVAAAAAVGASAFACSNLATISPNAEAGRPGDTITIVGTSFPVPRTAAGTPTSVVIRWGSNEGPILATVIPDRTGTISATFTVPPSDPGNVVILAIQRRPVLDPDAPDSPPKLFVDEPGTPARATFRVLAQGQTVQRTIPGNDLVAATTDDGVTTMVVLMVLFGAVSLSLFAGGVMAFLHQVRLKRTAPQAQPWRLPYP
jgi:hypothetical protein